MTIPQPRRGPAADERIAWIVAGSLLIASVLAGVAFQPPASVLPGGMLATLLYSAALLLLAFGVRGSGSVTALRPLGTGALLVLAAWAFAGPMVGALASQQDLADGDLMGFGYADTLLQFAAALVAVTQIARAGVVPRPWNLAPAWGLAAVAAPWLVEQLVSVDATGEVPPVTLFLMAIDGLVRMAAPLFLGVLAIVLANRTRHPRTVPVHRTSA
jgi:hypothetical protein